MPNDQLHFDEKQLAFLLATLHWYRQEFEQLSHERQLEFKALATRSGTLKPLSGFQIEQLKWLLEKTLAQRYISQSAHNHSIYELADLKALLAVDEGLRRSVEIITKVMDLETEATLTDVDFPSYQRHTESGWRGLEVVNGYELRLWGDRALPGIEATITYFISDEGILREIFEGEDYDPDCLEQRGILEISAGEVLCDRLLGELVEVIETLDPPCYWKAEVTTRINKSDRYHWKGLDEIVLRRQRNQ